MIAEEQEISPFELVRKILVLLAPDANVHPIPCTAAVNRGLDAAWAAGQYAAVLRGALLLDRGMPVFDVIVVGLGPDGHLLSVFPDSPAFASPEPVVAVPAPTHIAPHVARVTLNPATLEVARAVIVVATGAGKADAVASVLAAGAGSRGLVADDADRLLPARRALRPGATWVIDAAAAARSAGA